MFQTSAIIIGVVLIFVLASGLIVLLHPGADDLDAWGLFVAQVLYGDRRSTWKLLRGPGN